MLKKFLFLSFLLLPLQSHAAVIINEVAWMGTFVSANDEWIELHNMETDAVDLAGWRLVAVDGQPEIIVDDVCVNTVIAAGGYFLLERTDDQTVPSISADCIYTGALGNTSEQIELFNTSGSVIDSVYATDGWPAGDNATKETMQKSGGGWMTATATPKKANFSSDSANSSEDTSETNSPNTDSSSSQQNGSPGGADEPYVQPENLPRIKVDAGEDQQAVVGEQVQFRPHAWGLDNVLLENARYVWNFGNGATYEGQNVAHEYMFPGTYTVRVIVSSGKYSALDDLQVVVRKNTVVVSEAMPGETGWIEFQNVGEKAIHMGGWILETTNGRFVIPVGTILASRSVAVLSAAITHIVLVPTGDHVHIFYPNGTYASGFQYVFQVPQGKSISNNEGVVLFIEPTPGNFHTPEHMTVARVAEQTLSIPVVSRVSATTQNSIQFAQPALREQEKSLVSTQVQNVDIEPNFQSATLGDAPLLSKTNREAFWFGGSLVLGGLAAAGAVLFRRRKSSTNDTML